MSNYVARINHNGVKAEFYRTLEDRERLRSFDMQSLANDALHSTTIRDEYGKSNPVEVAVCRQKIQDGKLLEVMIGRYSAYPLKNPMSAEAFISEEEKGLAEIPAEFHSVIREWAWDKGHSSGYDEVVSILRELAGSLKKPIEAFKERLTEGK